MQQRQRMNSKSITRSYDVIFVGQLGAVVAHHFMKHLNFSCKCLVINNSKKIIEPSLSFIHHEKIKIRKLCPENCDLEYKCIAHIRPIIREVEMESGCVYYYRYLVYGQNNWADLDFIPRLRQALSNQFSLIYSNWEKTDLSKIYKYDSGNLVFYVPKNRHCGYQNYNFLEIYSKFMKSKAKNRQQFKCKVILQGTTFLPFNQQGDQFIKSQLRQNGVELILNSKITKIDYLRRRLTLNENKEVSYTIFYCLLHQKTPKMLLDADIDPYDNNPKALYNKKHKNIFIFGSDIFPTTHSFTAINNQAHVIRHNLLNFLQKKDDVALYNGQSSIKFWINEREAVQFSHDYHDYNTITSNCFSNYLRFLNYKAWASWQADIFYNLNSDGQPFYVVSPTFLDSKTSNNQCEDKNSIKGLRSNLVIESFVCKQSTVKS